MAIINGEIKCSRCRELKALEMFPKHAVKSGCGACKACALIYSSDWRARNKERVLSGKRERYAKDPDSAAKAKASREARREQYSESQKAWWDSRTAEQKKHYALKKYGMSFDEYEELLASQGGGCAICKAATNKNGKALFVDHCHDTGRVRGILCYKCNTGLGSFSDSPELIQKALIYLT